VNQFVLAEADSQFAIGVRLKNRGGEVKARSSRRSIDATARTGAPISLREFQRRNNHLGVPATF
jgi:hypothetical protein